MKTVAIISMLSLSGCYYELRVVDTVVTVVSGKSLREPRIREPKRPAESQEVIRMKLRIAEKKLKILKEQRMQQLLTKYHSL